MEDKIYYTKQAASFIKLTDYLDSVLTVYGNVHNVVALRARGAAIEGAHDGYNEIIPDAKENGVDIGTRENFSELLQSQIDKALKENKKEYADYIKAILHFLEFYYRRF